MNLNQKKSETSLRIGPVRFSYANVFTPRADASGKEKYSCCIIIPKSNKEAIELINGAVEAAKLIGKNKSWEGRIPANLKTPLRDGDEERPDDEAFANSYFFNCSSKNRPGVAVKENGIVSEAMPESNDFYSGCYGAVVVNFYPYNSNGNRGIGAGLQNLVKTEDGERLAGGGESLDASFDDLND